MKMWSVETSEVIKAKEMLLLIVVLRDTEEVLMFSGACDMWVRKRRGGAWRQQKGEMME